MPVTGKYSIKPYQCKGCGHEKEQGTNHWGDIYPYCDICCSVTVWECQEEIPEGYEVPEKWKSVKLSDLVEVKKGVKLK